jgi:hypothetical protein
MSAAAQQAQSIEPWTEAGFSRSIKCFFGLPIYYSTIDGITNPPFVGESILGSLLTIRLSRAA